MFEAVSNVKIGSTNMPVESSSASVSQEGQLKKPAKTNEEKHKSAVPQEFLNNLEQDIEMIHNVGLKFSVHEPTGRTIVRVVNKDTGNLIREIPAKEILDLAAKLDELMGIIFDKTV